MRIFWKKKIAAASGAPAPNLYWPPTAKGRSPEPLIYCVSMPLFCLSHSFIYNTSVPDGTKTRTEVK